MERDHPPHLENPPAISGRQLDILRLLGKGNSSREVSWKLFGEQNSSVAVGRELKKIYRTFGVTGQTVAVVHALNIGLLRTEELVEKDFNWSLFNELKPIQISILEAFMHAKGEIFTEEEFSNLNITTSQDPKDYVWHSITAIDHKLGLENKTQTVVYYYAFRERQMGQEYVEVPTVKKILTNKEIQTLEWLAKGLSPSVIAKNRWVDTINTRGVYQYRNRIFAKLGVTNIEAAAVKAREMGMLKN